MFDISGERPETGAGQSGTGDPPRTGGVVAATERSGEDKKPRRKEAETVKLQALPRAPNFRSWKMAVRNEIAGASGDPHTAFQWNLEDSESFPSLDAKLAAAITRIAQGDVSHRINLAMDLKAQAGKLVTGRQMLYIL